MDDTDASAEDSVAQLSEYWPLSKLSTLSNEAMNTPSSPLLTHHSLTIQADVVLAHKLVPQGVLDLILSKTELIIAKKFLGNADESLEEMVHFAVEGARKGFSQQADLSIYDHSSEETLFFRTQGFEPFLISCISSALARPTFVGIPLTHGSVGAGYRCRSMRWLF
ncbi:uncharacterized protein LACBIDRAFT_306686 [Laccaria bicolor S238N-H82]|uniref:Predicted protein n=1 Tax=Laccaria bicolor (strain S238N-H82 / ATCC MYA-4686) TaxID=486041 RepID=B0DNJ8_LACBS|nr:uncharacterized protein LACBIDRAFT_306686 [Laccaria bicolor S238N-H82]EDR03954.1 predicted protein [Laccaria bicolor S238N-H82]|eukprot:XP_001885522.1 predicted protein [Laccaria bicolor S238N-H82]